MSIDESTIDEVLDKDVHGSDGEKIGAVGQVFLDDVTGKPEWVTVKTGLFGTKETFVPIAAADLSADGITVPYTKDLVKDAPSVDADSGHLSKDEEAGLYRHYSLDNPDGAPTEDAAARVGDDGDRGESRQADEDGDAVVDGRHAEKAAEDTVGHDTSGPTTDEAMTLSEERLNVGTRTEETGRARLRKYVVTEEETVTVPVTREKVVLEREPITDANRGQAEAGPEISEEEHEVVLHEERPVVEKETVAVERVALGTETTTEDVQVTEEVRKEQLETDGVDVDDPLR